MSRTPASITNAILRKWRAQGTFLRFLDGNVQNAAVTNMQYVTLGDAMAHVDDWVVDWDMDLTKAERLQVLNPAWRAGLSFSA